MTEILIKNGVSVRAIPPLTGDSPLHSAAATQRNKSSDENKMNLESIIQLLIENGAEVDLLNKKGFTPLQLAIKEGNFNLVQLLVRLGASVNRKLASATDFHYVSKLATMDVVYTFLEYGADSSVFDDNGLTPYQISMSNPNASVPKAFWKSGCSFNQIMEEKPKLNTTADNMRIWKNQLEFFVGILINDVTLMSDSVKSGGVVKACSKLIPYPLHWAVKEDFISIVYFMLDRGAVIGWLDDSGETPLHVAARCGHYLKCLYLLSFGSSYNVPSKSTGKLPVDLALENNHSKVVDVFKEIDELFKCRDRKTIFNRVKCKIENCRNELYMLLAVLNCVNRMGNSLLALSLKKGHRKLARLIMSFRISSKAIPSNDSPS